MEKLLKRLNPAQREAVYHKNGPLLVLAGAGSGKTTTMATRIAYLIAKHQIAAENILGLSFTRKAAGELKERVVKMISQTSGERFAKGLTLSTFHALCVRILRAHAKDIGFSPTFSILDQNDQSDIVKSILRQIKLDDRKFDADLIKFEIGQAKNRFMGPDEAREFFLTSKRMPEDYAIATCSVYERYQDRLLALNALDFDDLLFQAVRLLELSAEARAFYNSKFHYILVDEYQDTNPSQFRLLRLLTRDRQNICVVGDDDQSIYAWRGADPLHILEFGHQFQGARTITLDQNYRSTTVILDAANEVIAKNQKRHPKKLWSDKGQGEPIIQMILEEDRAEAEAVAEEILRRKEDEKAPRRWQDFAILYRSNPQSRLFEEALRMRKIPYKIVGALSYLERKEVKDTLSYWRVVQNPKDDPSFRRVCNWPARGLGKSAVDALNAYALEHELSLYDTAVRAMRGEISIGLSPKAIEAIRKFVGLITEMRLDLERTPAEREAMADWGKRALTKIGVKEAIFEENEDPKVAERKWENALELSNALGQAEIPAPVAPEAPVKTPARRYIDFTDIPGSSAFAEEDEPSFEEAFPGVSFAASAPESVTSTESASEPAPAMGSAPLAQPHSSTVSTNLSEAPSSSATSHLKSVQILADFLQAMTLDPRDDDDDDAPKDEVTLLTLHGSKGLEFPIVFLVGTEEGYLPHQRTIDSSGPEALLGYDEERRLAYVGITRAQQQLILSRAKHRIRYGKKVPRLPSRFIEDIPKSLILVQDESEVPEPTSKEEQDAHELKVKDFLSQIRNRIQGGTNP